MPFFLYLGVSKMWFCCKVGHRKYIFVVYRAISKMQFCVGGHENAIFSMIMWFWILAKFYPQLYRWHLKCFFLYICGLKNAICIGGLKNAVCLYVGVLKMPFCCIGGIENAILCVREGGLENVFFCMLGSIKLANFIPHTRFQMKKP